MTLVGSAIRKRRRIAARLAEIRARSEYLFAPCADCAEDIFSDGDEYLTDTLALCWSCVNERRFCA